MNQNNIPDGLIIIPSENESDIPSKDKREPDWVKLNPAKIRLQIPGRESDVPSAEFKEKSLKSFVFFCEKVYLDGGKEENEKKLETLLVELYDWFDFENKFMSTTLEKVVFLCHFHCSMNEVRQIYKDICVSCSKDVKHKLKEFENPIFGKGNVIFESYTIADDFNTKLKGLIAELKEITTEEEKTPSEEEKKRISSIFREIFDCCWDNVKIVETLVKLIIEIKTQLFVRYHSDGKCADDLKNLSTQLQKYKDILEQSTGDDSIIERLNLENAMINSNTLKDIDKALESILSDILNKRDGTKKQSQS